MSFGPLPRSLALCNFQANSVLPLHIQRLVDLCPRVQGNTPNTLSGLYPLDTRSQAALLDLGDYVLLSDAQFLHDIIPYICLCYVNMPNSRFSDVFSVKNNQTRMRSYTEKLTRLLLDLSRTHPQTRQRIFESVISLINQLKSLETPSQSNIFSGILSVLSTDMFPFDPVSATEVKDIIINLLDFCMKKEEENKSKPIAQRETLNWNGKFKALIIGTLGELMERFLTEFSTEEGQVLYKKVEWILKYNLSKLRVKYKPKNVTTQTYTAILTMCERAITVMVWCATVVEGPEMKAELLKRLFDIIRKTIKQNIALIQDGRDESARIIKPVLEGVKRVCEHAPANIAAVVESYKATLFSPLLASHSSKEALREEITDSLGSILDFELTHSEKSFESSVTRSFILSLGGLLHRAAQDPVAKPDEQDVLLLLGRVTSIINNSMVIDQVLPVLVGKFTNNDKLLHLVVPHMADIAAGCNDEHTFTVIFNLFFDAYRNPFSRDNKINVKEVQEAFNSISSKLKDPGLRNLFLQKFLKLLHDLGFAIQKEASLPNRRFSEMAAVFGWLLPSFSELVRADVQLAHFPVFALLEDCPETLNGIRAFPSIENNIKYFRSVWFYLVLYKFVEDEPPVWPEHWFAATTLIASNSPVLIAPFTSQSFLDIELEALSVNKIGGTTVDVHQSLTKSLGTHLPESLLPQINTLTFAKTMYLLTVFHLERLRARTATFHHMFAYLSNPSIMTSGLAVFMGCVADQVFKSYLTSVHSDEFAAVRDVNITNHVVFLLCQCCSRYKIVREKARRYLKQLVVSENFPFIQWHKLCLGALLELLHAVFVRIRGMEVLSSYEVVNSVPVALFMTLPDGVQSRFVYLDLPTERSKRIQIVRSLGKMATQWLESAKVHVPLETLLALQELLQDNLLHNVQLGQGIGVRFPHYGLALAIRQGLNTNSAVLSTLYNNTSTSEAFDILPHPITRSSTAVFASSLGLKQRYLGEIHGWFQQFLAYFEEGSVGFGVFMTRRFEYLFRKVIKAFYGMSAKKMPENEKIQSMRQWEKQYQVLMYRIAALLVWSCKGYAAEGPNAEVHSRVETKELLYMLCNGPARVFTKVVLEVGVFTWGWLFSASHDLALELIVNMKSPWASTVERGKGLFNHTPDNPGQHGKFPGCLFTPRAQRQTSDLYDEIYPHRIWIQFLYDRFEAITAGNSGSVLALTMMLHEALAKPEHFSLLPCSFVPRFMLLHMGLRLVHFYAETSDETSELLELLRDRIYLCAYFWFSEPANWLTARRFDAVRENARVLINVCKALQKENEEREFLPATGSGNHRGDSPASSVSGMRRSSLPPGGTASVASFHSTRSRISNTVSGSRRILKSRSNRNLGVFMSTRSIRETRQALSARGSQRSGNLASIESKSQSTHTMTTGKPVSQYLLFRDLLILLLSSELDRMIMWYNPRKDPVKNFTDQELFADYSSGISQDKWRVFFFTSWQVDARLCYHFVDRFDHVAVLKTLLTDRIRESPALFYEIPESVVYLATPENIARDAPVLVHLAYFDSCSLPTALRFLKTPYSHHQIVTEYAMRSLGSHSVDAQLFYLNQIIQALRYDRFGLLKAFLLRSCAASNYLAHQLIWACQLESVVDLTSNRGSGMDGALDPLPRICLELEKEIIGCFTEEAKAVYENEFGFIERICQFSIDLLDIPKSDKSARNLELRKCLKEIPITSNDLYLPIEHRWKIRDIISESGICLQSAAKVPFLVAFKVIDATARRTKIPRQKFTTAVIFKAGDDVRQDALSLQYMQLIKDIFISVDLPLFVLPYKVVPNRIGPNRDLGGVIECVKQAKSRDELGKSNGLSLKQHFISKYGQEDSRAFKTAQRNFILSCAGYAIACHILQVKDRHNGNIMLNDAGFLIHIDFGFIFDITPGKDMKFENAGFKFTVEMCELMGGQYSELYYWFLELCVRGFLAVRAHVWDFYNLANLMMDSPIGCFKSESMSNLLRRFCHGKSEREAAAFMISMVEDAYNKYTTNIYDMTQAHQQGIYYFRGGSENM